MVSSVVAAERLRYPRGMKTKAMLLFAPLLLGVSACDPQPGSAFDDPDAAERSANGLQIMDYYPLEGRAAYCLNKNLALPECDSDSGKKWNWTDDDLLKNKKSGLCITVAQGALKMADCDKTDPAQQWVLRVSDDFFPTNWYSTGPRAPGATIESVGAPGNYLVPGSDDAILSASSWHWYIPQLD